MAIKTIKTETIEDETTQPQSLDSVMEWAAANQEQSQFIGRIYRVREGLAGKVEREAVGKCFCECDEEFLGTNYGPGKYSVIFQFKDQNGERCGTTRIYCVGRELCGGYFEQQQPQQMAHEQATPVGTPGGLTLQGFLDGMNLQKAAGLVALIKGVKELFEPKHAPQPPQMDVAKIIEIVANLTKAPAIDSAIVIKALDMQQREKQQPSILQQINELKQVKEAVMEGIEPGAAVNENNGDKMDALLEMAFKYLPGLLAKKNNDFAAVGREVQQNAMVSGLISQDPELAQRFFEQAAKKYGIEAANAMAAGYGYNVSENAPQPPQMAQEQPQKPLDVEEQEEL